MSINDDKQSLEHNGPLSLDALELMEKDALPKGEKNSVKKLR
ncbi:MAG: hypothetical protein PSN44_07530 [Gammaproteobacteria bacterium]|nr:hypothetical protein [Gammaproteobacteria bacterium]